MPERKNKKPFDLIRRGEKKPTLSGTLTFIGLRAADIRLQHALLSPGPRGLGVRLLTSLGICTVFTDMETAEMIVPPDLKSPIVLFALTHPSLSPLQSFKLRWLTKFTPVSFILLLMSVGSAAKQIYWHLALSQDSFPASAAVAVSAYNTFVNSANSLLFLAVGTTSLLSRPRLSFFTEPPYKYNGILVLPLSTIVGVLLYVAGMTIETVSERQRAAFKSRAENKGKVCMEGLWRWARHINYFGYALWRGGYCMVGAGWIGGLIMGLSQGWDLSQRAVAVQDDYCSHRYKEQWVRFKQEVPYRIIPGIY